MAFPVFHGGIGPLDSKGRAEKIARECGGVRIESGDWIFGDADGVVVIPQAIAGRFSRRL
jgi:regulator of RNase E activity RraA